jgi:hypothetical protein
MNKLILLLILPAYLLTPPCLSAQDSLLALVGNEARPTREKVISTFSSSRLINAQTTETPHKRNLDFRVAHRFGDFLSPQGDDSRGGFHSLYGLDDPAFDIRIAFEYGISDNLMAGFSRSKYNEDLEGILKYRLVTQTTDNAIPVSLTLFGSVVATPKRDPFGVYPHTWDRFTYTAQCIIARKFSSNLSLELIPSLVYRNLFENSRDHNAVYSIGVGGRWKITKHFALMADYFYNFRNSSLDGIYYDPLSVGIEIETGGGHVFSIMFTNAQYINESGFITNTTESWSKNGWKLCFNISRIFFL